MAKNSVSTTSLAPRTRSLPKDKPNGRRRQIQEDAVFEEDLVDVEQANKESFGGMDAAYADDANDSNVSVEDDDGDPTENDDASEDLASAGEAASYGSSTEEPAQPSRRGRPRGASNKASSKPRKESGAVAAENASGSVLSELCNISFMVKSLADRSGKEPAQILSALSQVVEAGQALL